MHVLFIELLSVWSVTKLTFALFAQPSSLPLPLLSPQFGLVCLAASGHFALGATLPWPSPALSSMAENNSTLVGTEITLTPAQMDMTGARGGWAGQAKERKRNTRGGINKQSRKEKR